MKFYRPILLALAVALALPMALLPALAATNTNSTAAADVKLSAPVREILKMADSGVGADVLTAFVNNSSSTFNLNPDSVIHLRDRGIPSAVISAMLSHDKEMRDANRQSAYPAEPRPSAVKPTSGAAPSGTQPLTSTAPPPDAGLFGTDAAGFYEDLAPYGTWENLPGYGYVWQPDVAASEPGWAPYANNGQWLYSNYGWYWDSFYPWGWATFHFGRWWNQPGRGWVWFPGTAWASSWVNWRFTEFHCGWKPLSPFDTGATADNRASSAEDYTFISFRHFNDRDPGRFRLGSQLARAILARSSAISNTFFTGADSLIANRGIHPNTIAAASQTQVHRVNIEIPPATEEPLLDNMAAPETAYASLDPYAWASPNYGGYWNPIIWAGSFDDFDGRGRNRFGRFDGFRTRFAANVGPQPSTARSSTINPRFPQNTVAGQRSGLLNTGQPSTAQSMTINPMFPNLRPGGQLPQAQQRRNQTFLAPFDRPFANSPGGLNNRARGNNGNSAAQPTTAPAPFSPAGVVASPPAAGAVAPKAFSPVVTGGGGGGGGHH